MRVALGHPLHVDRAAPRVLHVGQLRADRRADPHEVALVGPRRAAADGGDGEEVVAQVLVVREAAAAEEHRLASAHVDGLPVRRGGDDPDDLVVVAEHEPLHAVAGADVDAGRLRGRGHAAHGDQAAVRLVLVEVVGREVAGVVDLVLLEVGPVVRPVGRVAGRQRAAVVQQLGGRPGALVDRLVERELHSLCPKVGLSGS
ncbi:MAG: hypothetical protein R2736_14595 [Solirubrobacterales bacterium]